MLVSELVPPTVEIDIPIDGFGGTCDRKSYTRNRNTVTRMEEIHGQIGVCIIRADVTTELTFFDDDSVSGSETNEVQADGGDCAGVSLPCTVELQVNGARCIGCFACVDPTAETGSSVLGPLAAGAGKSLRVRLPGP